MSKRITEERKTTYSIYMNDYNDSDNSLNAGAIPPSCSSISANNIETPEEILDIINLKNKLSGNTKYNLSVTSNDDSSYDSTRKSFTIDSKNKEEIINFLNMSKSLSPETSNDSVSIQTLSPISSLDGDVISVDNPIRTMITRLESMKEDVSTEKMISAKKLVSHLKSKGVSSIKDLQMVLEKLQNAIEEEHSNSTSNIMSSASSKLELLIGGNRDINFSMKEASCISAFVKFATASKKSNPETVVSEMSAYHEEIMLEVAPSDQEEWVKSNKSKFQKEYGKKKGTDILYATAWKRSKLKESSDEYGKLPSKEEIEKLKGKPLQKYGYNPHAECLDSGKKNIDEKELKETTEQLWKRWNQTK